MHGAPTLQPVSRAREYRLLLHGAVVPRPSGHQSCPWRVDLAARDFVLVELQHYLPARTQITISMRRMRPTQRQAFDLGFGAVSSESREGLLRSMVLGGT